MRVLLIDSDGTGTDIAYRAAEAGHTVRWFQPPDKGRPSRDGKGFEGVEKVTQYREHLPWARGGLIINLFNEPGITKELDKYREFGFPIFGPSIKSANLEINRAAGMKFMKKHGLEVPEYESFTSLEEALKYAMDCEESMVFKTLGSEEDKSLSYVGANPADMVGKIQEWMQGGMKLKGPCMLQKKIDGIEVGVSGWMGKKGFLKGKWNINFEHKKLMPGNYGPNTGEMGTVTQYVSESRLATESLVAMEDDLVALGHIGDIDVNFIVNEKGAYPLEFTCRFGWPSTQILMATHEGDPIQWMKDALAGRDTLKVSQNVACGLLMAAPPFPYPDDEQKAVGLLVSGIEDVWDRIAPWQIELTKGPVSKDGKITTGPVYKTTGPYVCVAIGQGNDVHDALPVAQEIAEAVEFANRIVRNDVGQKLEEQIPKLHAWGYPEIPNW